MTQKATKARLVQLAGLIENEARGLGLLAPGDRVHVETGSKVNGLSWGVWVIHEGRGGFSDTFGLGHLTRELPRAIDKAEGYFEALRRVTWAKNDAGRGAA